MSRWLCPASPTGCPCLDPLPCDKHGIPDYWTGWALWANSYFLQADE